MNNLNNSTIVYLKNPGKNLNINYYWDQSTNKDARTILVLPGLDESISDYQEFFIELKNKFPSDSILAIDLRGQGKTLENEGRIYSYKISVDQQITIISEVIQKLPIHSLFIIGLSYGAGIALYGANRLEHVSGLALMAPYVSKFKNFNRGFSGLWYTLIHMNPFYKVMSQLSLPFYFQMAKEKKKLNPNVLWTTQKLNALTKLSTGIMSISTTYEAHKLKELPQGVHFLVGESDELVSVEAVRHLYKKINGQNKTITVVPKLSHRLLIKNYKDCSHWLSEKLMSSEIKQ